ncbi:MAG: aspartate/glutamate racemase family protein, partial [Pseudomonadota bacterium]
SRVIFEELVNGTVLESSRSAYLKTIAQGRAVGADSVILGCTEITLLIKQDHTDLPVFDTTALHAKAIATAALKP